MSQNEIEIRKIILHKYLENSLASHRSIANTLNLSQSQVSCTLKRYKETNSVGGRPKADRKPDLSVKELAEKVTSCNMQISGLQDTPQAVAIDCLSVQ